MNEATALSQVRLELARRQWPAWRNNVGVLMDAKGRPVRYGLANDSKQVNSMVKSGDLIGVRPVVITPDMVGQTIGQFASWEIKRPGWKYNPHDQHEVAQLRWQQIVVAAGGYALFTTGEFI